MHTRRRILSLLVGTVSVAALAGCAGPMTNARSGSLAANEEQEWVDPRSLLLFLYAWNTELAGRNEDALAGYEAAIKIDPRSPALWAHKGSAEARLGRAQEAERSLRKAAELDPAYAPAHRWLAPILANEGKNDEAIAEWQAAIQHSTEPSAPALELARFLERQHRYGEAAEVLRPLAADGEPEVGNELADALLAAGKPDEAEHTLLSLVERHPDDREARLRLVRFYVATKNWKQASETQRALVKLMPGDVDALKTQALIDREMGKTEDAIRVLRGVVEQSPKDAEARSWLGDMLEQTGHGKEAVEQFQAIADADPSDPKAVWQLALAEARTGGTEQALATARSALAKKENEQSGTLHTLLGLLLVDAKRYPEALPELSRAAELEPKNEMAHFEWGVALDRTGDFPKAAEQFYKVLELNPKHAEAANYLGFSLADRGEKLDEALRLVQIAVSLEPDNGAYVDSLGWVHYRQGRFEEARKELEHAVALMSGKDGKGAGDPVVHEHLGDIYGRLGQRELARREYRSALKLDPGNVALQKKLASR